MVLPTIFCHIYNIIKRGELFEKDIFHTRFRMSESFDYIVKREDTLAKIAKAHGVDLKDLLRENQLPEIFICPGETIVVLETEKWEHIF